MPELRSPVDLSCFCGRLACLNTVPSGALVSEMACWRGTVLHGGRGWLLSALVPALVSPWEHEAPGRAESCPGWVAEPSQSKEVCCAELGVSSLSSLLQVPSVVPGEQPEQEEYLLATF